MWLATGARDYESSVPPHRTISVRAHMGATFAIHVCPESRLARVPRANLGLEVLVRLQRQKIGTGGGDLAQTRPVSCGMPVRLRLGAVQDALEQRPIDGGFPATALMDSQRFGQGHEGRIVLAANRGRFADQFRFRASSVPRNLAMGGQVV